MFHWLTYLLHHQSPDGSGVLLSAEVVGDADDQLTPDHPPGNGGAYAQHSPSWEPWQSESSFPQHAGDARVFDGVWCQSSSGTHFFQQQIDR